MSVFVKVPYLILLLLSTLESWYICFQRTVIYFESSLLQGSVPVIFFLISLHHNIGNGGNGYLALILINFPLRHYFKFNNGRSAEKHMVYSRISRLNCRELNFIAHWVHLYNFLFKSHNIIFISVYMSSTLIHLTFVVKCFCENT